MRMFLGKARRRPSPAMVVSLIALFVALSGTTYAATGGNFILGQTNTATSPTNLTANSTGRILQLIQQNTSAGASGLGINVPAGKPPISTNSTTKVVNLNADALDGLDSEAFAQGFATRTQFKRRTVTPTGGEVTLLSFPGWFDLNADCSNGIASVYLRNRSTTEFDYGSTDVPAGGDLLYIAGTDPNVRYGLFEAGSSGEMHVVNMGQSYTLAGGGVPRTRMATLSVGIRGIGGTSLPSCLFQVQSLAQGF